MLCIAKPGNDSHFHRRVSTPYGDTVAVSAIRNMRSYERVAWQINSTKKYAIELTTETEKSQLSSNKVTHLNYKITILFRIKMLNIQCKWQHCMAH